MKSLALPDFTLVTASAGSGKTTELTKRYLTLLMTGGIPFNNLRHILAITFTKNAAKEMKERILEMLKGAALGQPEALNELRQVLLLDDESLRATAAMYVELILNDYSDFQVQTIDSFITRVLKASALDLGLPPEFEVSFNADSLLDEVLELFARQIATDPSQRQLFEQLIDLMSDQQREDAKFLWNPYGTITVEMHKLYRQLSAQKGEPLMEEAAGLNNIGKKILEQIEAIRVIAEKSEFTVTANYRKILDAAKKGNVATIVERSLLQDVLKKSADGRFQKTAATISAIQKNLPELVSQYLVRRSRSYYVPYLRAYRMIQHLLEEVKRRRGTVVLSEANRTLAKMLTAEIVPEIYFSLGELIHHHLVDEFQDTSPLQWAVLRPLIAESLSKDGSLFTVGDTKQSIYTFRGGDWRIMRRMMERDEFPSVKTTERLLTTNYRSAQQLVEFTKELFHTRVPMVISPDISDRSGLVSYEQDVSEKNKSKGYVEVHLFEAPEKNVEEQSVSPPEQKKLLSIIKNCRGRGYRYGDIAILTPRNHDVVEVSRWLNDGEIPFLSHSSLDIRTRKLTGELLALLRFLDSPVDDLAFATVLLGEIFSAVTPQTAGKQEWHTFVGRTAADGRKRTPLYSRFRSEYPDLWNRYFEHLFNLVGYLPVYDLVAEIYKAFDLFSTQSAEEATLVKFLEVVKNVEAKGNSSLKDFLVSAEDEEEESSDVWNVDVAGSEDAVSVMTVHKAKGLGFPVLVTLFYDRPVRVRNPFVVESEEGVELLRVTSDSAGKSEELHQRYQEARTYAQLDDLNRLYVALTRAREELYVLSVKRKRGDQPSVFFPTNGTTAGTPTRKQQDEKGKGLDAPTLALHTRGLTQARNFDALKLPETRRGEFIHNVLSDFEYLDSNTEEAVSASLTKWSQRGRSDISPQEVHNTLLEFLAAPEVKAFFSKKSERLVLNEQEIVDRLGGLHRVDRMIADQDDVTILDYKTGDEQETYNEQVREYMDVVRGIYPGKRVQGFLLYVDLNVIREVR
jgi:ATP-dependent exoDNAse (exonuclease V) beta subunit